MGNFQRPAWTAASGSAQDGPPGKFNEVIVVTDSLICTGSAWPIGAVIVPTGVTGNIVCKGGTIVAADIAGAGVVEVGPLEITSVAGGNLYALKRNHGTN